MARLDFESWIPEEPTSAVLQRVNQTSGIERFARGEPMSSATKSVPRSSGAGVDVIGKGQPYTEDDANHDDVVLVARKFGRVMRIAEEDINDSLPAVISTKLVDWATSYAKALDNACLATTGAENGGSVPFTSVYRALSQADSEVGYTANANIVQTGGDLEYDALSAFLGLYEESDYFDPSNTVVIAHPSFRAALRGIKDDNGAPIFVQGQGSDGGTPQTLFGEFPLAFSLGAKTSPTLAESPGGNPLLVIANRQHLILGRRSGPESVVIPGRDGVAALTDETLLKVRSRRGFVLGHPNAAVVLERTASG